MQMPPEACTKKQLIIAPSEIHMLRFILEAYDGIALVTTLDADLGMVELSIAPGCEEEVVQILDAEEENLQLRPIWQKSSAKPFTSEESWGSMDYQLVTG